MTAKLLTLAEVSERLAVSLRTVERMVADGELAVVRIRRQVRVRPQDVDAYLEAARLPTQAERRRATIRALPNQAAARPTLRPGYWRQ